MPQRDTKGELIDVDSPFKMPDADKRTGTQEPFVKLEMLTPQVMPRTFCKYSWDARCAVVVEVLMPLQQRPGGG